MSLDWNQVKPSFQQFLNTMLNDVSWIKYLMVGAD